MYNINDLNDVLIYFDINKEKFATLEDVSKDFALSKEDAKKELNKLIENKIVEKTGYSPYGENDNYFLLSHKGENEFQKIKNE